MPRAKIGFAAAVDSGVVVFGSDDRTIYALEALVSSRSRFAGQVAVLEAVRAGRLELVEAFFARRRALFSTRHQRFLLRTAPPDDAGTALQAVGGALGHVPRLCEAPRP